MATKHCKQCDQSYNVIECFYKASGNAYQSLCIKCHNNNRYTKKTIGFKKLSIETRQGILADIRAKLSYKKIAEKYDIKYQTLIVWKNRNTIISD